MEKGSYLYKEMSRYRIKLIVIFAVLFALFMMDTIYRWPYIKTECLGPSDLNVERFLSETDTITISEPVVLGRRERVNPTAEYLKATSYWQDDKYCFNVKLDSIEDTGKAFQMRQKAPGQKEAAVNDIYRLYTAEVGGRKVAVLSFADQKVTSSMVACLVDMERPVLAGLSENLQKGESKEISRYVVDVRQLEMEAASSDYVFFWIWLVLLLIFLIRIVSYFVKPILTPTYRQLYKYGDIASVAEEINRQTEEKETYRDGKKTVTKDYILQRDWFKLKVVRNHLAKN